MLTLHICENGSVWTNLMLAQQYCNDNNHTESPLIIQLLDNDVIVSGELWRCQFVKYHKPRYKEPERKLSITERLMKARFEYTTKDHK